jgi:aspartate aminotransferase
VALPRLSSRAAVQSAGLPALGLPGCTRIISIVTAFTLADRMSRLGTESAFEVLARAKALEAAGAEIIHLEIGEPDFPTAPHIVEAAAGALQAGQTHYVPAPDIPPQREAVAGFLERTDRMRVSPDRVIVTHGKPIMFFTIMALCGEGDEVLYPDPSFPMYESITAFAGVVGVPVPLREQNGFRIDTDGLKTAGLRLLQAAHHQLPGIG